MFVKWMCVAVAALALGLVACGDLRLTYTITNETHTVTEIRVRRGRPEPSSVLTTLNVNTVRSARLRYCVPTTVHGCRRRYRGRDAYCDR